MREWTETKDQAGTGGMSKGAEDRRDPDTAAKTGAMRELGEDDGVAGKLRDGAQFPDAWGLGMHHSKIETRGTCIPVISHLSSVLRPTKREAGLVTDQ